jgi:hypothetical protein
MPDDDILRGLGTVDDADRKLEALRERLAQRLREENAVSERTPVGVMSEAAATTDPTDLPPAEHRALADRLAAQDRTIRRLTRLTWALAALTVAFGAIAITLGVALAGR